MITISDMKKHVGKVVAVDQYDSQLPPLLGQIMSVGDDGTVVMKSPILIVPAQQGMNFIPYGAHVGFCDPVTTLSMAISSIRAVLQPMKEFIAKYNEYTGSIITDLSSVSDAMKKLQLNT